MEIKNSIAKYTEADFLSFIKEIVLENVAEIDERLDVLLDNFEKIIEHPEGTDLIYYASSDGERTPEAITTRVKEWRDKNGKSGFKIG
ncbi:colicin transporter [Pectobacterium betavasculorum]|uniref:Colicin transporter n=1 Tax=Pectobacterium betavasculorum TaxID=55207 RepID=A0A093RRC6_9GAMM|nr:bacteriocin immunity protein [Pectobacterium betavasculorum]KFX05365.1 colicin transporter [Pectobacterium betavasculorum]